MKTSPLLNKTIYKVRVQKGLLAIKVIMGIFPLVVLYQTNNENSDYTILNQLLQESTTRNPNKVLFLAPSKDNRYIKEMVLELRDSTTLASRSDEWPSYGINRDSIFDQIFNDTEYDHLMSQTDVGSWDFDKITVPGISEYVKGRKSHNGITCFVSKPVYTKNQKYALVACGDRFLFYVIVYRKSYGKWIQYRQISHMIS